MSQQFIYQQLPYQPVGQNIQIQASTSVPQQTTTFISQPNGGLQTFDQSFANSNKGIYQIATQVPNGLVSNNIGYQNLSGPFLGQSVSQQIFQNKQNFGNSSDSHQVLSNNQITTYYVQNNSTAPASQAGNMLIQNQQQQVIPITFTLLSYPTMQNQNTIVTPAGMQMLSGSNIGSGAQIQNVNFSVAQPKQFQQTLVDTGALSRVIVNQQQQVAQNPIFLNQLAQGQQIQFVSQNTMPQIKSLANAQFQNNAPIQLGNSQAVANYQNYSGTPAGIPPHSGMPSSQQAMMTAIVNNNTSISQIQFSKPVSAGIQELNLAQSRDFQNAMMQRNVVASAGAIQGSNELLNNRYQQASSMNISTNEQPKNQIFSAMKETQIMGHSNKPEVNSAGFRQSSATQLKIQLAQEQLGGCQTNFNSMGASSSYPLFNQEVQNAQYQEDQKFMMGNKPLNTYNRQQPSQIHDKNPRETVMQRLMERFGLTDDSEIRRLPGELVDLSNFEEKLPVPSTRNFTQFKFIRNPYSNAQRQTTMYSCDHSRCGKFFKKPQGLFDHLRIHTGEKPFICPVDKCCQSFNQVANQKKHLDSHKGGPYLRCRICRVKITKRQLIKHYEDCIAGKNTEKNMELINNISNLSAENESCSHSNENSNEFKITNGQPQAALSQKTEAPSMFSNQKIQNGHCSSEIFSTKIIQDSDKSHHNQLAFRSVDNSYPHLASSVNDVSQASVPINKFLNEEILLNRNFNSDTSQENSEKRNALSLNLSNLSNEMQSKSNQC